MCAPRNDTAEKGLGRQCSFSMPYASPVQRRSEKSWSLSPSCCYLWQPCVYTHVYINSHNTHTHTHTQRHTDLCKIFATHTHTQTHTHTHVPSKTLTCSVAQLRRMSKAALNVSYPPAHHRHELEVQVQTTGQHLGSNRYVHIPAQRQTIYR
jgi:hypothetical protein